MGSCVGRPSAQLCVLVRGQWIGHVTDHSSRLWISNGSTMAARFMVCGMLLCRSWATIKRYSGSGYGLFARSWEIYRSQRGIGQLDSETRFGLHAAEQLDFIRPQKQHVWQVYFIVFQNGSFENGRFQWFILLKKLLPHIAAFKCKGKKKKSRKFKNLWIYQ